MLLTVPSHKPGHTPACLLLRPSSAVCPGTSAVVRVHPPGLALPAACCTCCRLVLKIEPCLVLPACLPPTATMPALACSPSRKLLAMVEPVGGFPQPQPTLNGTAQMQPNGVDAGQLKVEPEEQGPIGVLNGTQQQQFQQLTPAESAYQAPVAVADGGPGSHSLRPVSGAQARGQGLEGEEAAVAVGGVHLEAQEMEFVCQLVQGQPGIFRAQVHALMTPQAGGFIARPPLNVLSALMLLVLLPVAITALLQGHWLPLRLKRQG